MAIGRIFHLIHMTGDLPALEAWYDDVFAVRRGFLDHDYLELEQRDASLVVLADVVIEPLAPAFRVQGWDRYPLGKFYNKFGNHWHSIAWYCDDATALWHTLKNNNIRMLGMVGATADEPPTEPSPIFTHPKDTSTQLEFLPDSMSAMTDLDPRLRPDYDPHWWVANHPLGLHGMAYTTVLVKDLDRATHVYADVLGGTLLEKSHSALTGTDDVYIRVGESVIQLSNPTVDGSIAAADMAANGEMHHAVCFRVQDLDKAEEYLRSKGVATSARDDHTLLCDPATTHGAPFRFTTRSAPRDI
ncbi:hypothetical protein G352_00502 [Rhodococcus ruber BKS 20-38]|uniref:VOC domain-containing protein n=1 Tax=Rhodococcus ruber BKS 20-38 TaxID=1278076 RepID=M3A4B2_9NOCA|nr:VOC family protein [Rhodococcus ruber]EME67319.1 hypothetical protein G352_00502 [Rhodococcus ruber BKS 20-38]